MGFAEGFSSGSASMRGIMQMGYDRQRQEKEDAWRQEDRDTAKTEREYMLAQRKGVDDSIASARALQGGVYNGDPLKAQPADFSGVSPQGDYGPVPQAQMAPVTGLRKPGGGYEDIARRDATGLETEQAFGNIAAAQKDVAGMRASAGKVRDIGWADAHAKMSDAELAAKYGPAFNKNHDIDGVLYFDPKDKQLKVKPYGEAPAAPVERSALMQYAYAAHQMGNGDVEKGLEKFAGLDDKSKVEALARATRLSGQATALAKNANDREELGIKRGTMESTDRYHRGMLGTTQAYHASQAAAGKMGTPVRMVNDKGEAVLGVPTMVNGKMTIQQADMGGLKFEKTQAASAKYEVANRWGEAEKTLMASNTPPADIANQKTQFFARNGVAPDQAVKALMEGRDPTTHEKMTERDVDEFNKTFPLTPMDKTQLPWLKPAGLKLPSEPGGMRPTALRQKYDELQAAKPSWYQQARPGQSERLRQLEDEYNQLVRSGAQ